MNILENKDYNYEDDQALLLVQMYGFKAGQLFLYTKKNMFPLILQHYIEKEDTEKVIEFCMEHGEEEHSLWINLLTYFSHMKKIDEKRLRSVLTYIEEHHIMPVLSVLDALSKCESITLDLMKDYILKELEESHNQQEQNRSYIDDLKKKNQEMSDEIIKLQTYPLFSNFFFCRVPSLCTSCKVFQQQYCANCGDKLDVPTVHYMCGHSFHQVCSDGWR